MTSSGEIPSSCLHYSLRTVAELSSSLAYLLLLLLSLASVVAFLFLSLLRVTAEFSVVPVNTLFGEELVISFHVCGLH